MTGGWGFAGSHLVTLLRERGEEPAAPRRSELDLLDSEAVAAFVRRLQPRAVFHLAARASVRRSWEDPGETLRANLGMTLNVLEAVRREGPGAPALLVGSGEIYGNPERLPVDEDARLRPQNPYAVSKAGCDLLGGQYADAHKLGVVRIRTFNHAGPGQSEEYVVGTLTRQVAEAELAGRGEARLRVGNLDAARDFTDVRDVVRAYAAAVELPAGVYNVCSGRSVSVLELVEELGRVASVEVRAEVDPERVRAHEVPEIRGSADRLREATGWEPEIPLERTLSDALAVWRERLAA
ncbi:MAG TPA: GDP-mannose 4,6-dehydratase [Thermoleophilaceae bacterium]|nr:GDP-mannose 4,6-dehydratase [Thermoleophilaceae bacterium]